MKWIVAGIVIIAVLLILRARITDTGAVTVEVTGAPFRGAIGAGSSQRSVDGVSSMTYTIDGKDSRGIFVASLAKTQDFGTLKVKMSGCPDGRVRIQETSAPYGNVTITC